MSNIMRPVNCEIVYFWLRATRFDANERKNESEVRNKCIFPMQLKNFDSKMYVIKIIIIINNFV